MNFVFLCVFLVFITSSSALKCYTCSMGEDDADTTCVTAPEKLSSFDCNKKYCTVVRQEYKDPKGKVKSISRTCADAGRNEITEDETDRFYFSACTTTLCNGGTGKSTNGNQGALGDKSTIYCPGTGKSKASYSTISIYSLVIAGIIFLLP